MRRPDIEWVEKLEGGVRRKIRVTFFKDRIKWQTKRSDQEKWDYDTPPSPADWETLEIRVEALYYRRRFPYERLELVRKLRKKAGA